jgi:hypothetical protein
MTQTARRRKPCRRSINLAVIKIRTQYICCKINQFCISPSNLVKILYLTFSLQLILKSRTSGRRNPCSLVRRYLRFGEIIVTITNKMQLYRLIYYSKSALHVLGDIFVHHQENLNVFTVYGSVHPSRCRLVTWMSFQLFQLTNRQQLGWTLPHTVNTVKCSWWWTKISPETCRADVE